jgi:RNA polymerase sigma-70 factor, ECF subfamily
VGRSRAGETPRARNKGRSTVRAFSRLNVQRPERRDGPGWPLTGHVGGQILPTVVTQSTRDQMEAPGLRDGGEIGAGAPTSSDGVTRKGQQVGESRFGPARAAATGFHSTAAVDESPARLAQTRLAVARAKEGDRDALQFLYVRYSNNIYGYVRSIVRDDHEAEDVTQHVFAKLMTTLVKYDDRGVPFFAWLLRLARNVAIDHLRANRLTPTENVIDPDVSSVVDLDRVETVRAALATLPDEQRQVVILRHVVGLSPGEIADRMGRTESSIHGLHHRGRRALQRELARLDSAPLTRGESQLVLA